MVDKVERGKVPGRIFSLGCGALTRGGFNHLNLFIAKNNMGRVA